MIFTSLYTKTLNCIDLKDAEGFKNIFKDLDRGHAQEAGELAWTLLKEREAELLYPTPLRERYEFILNNLKDEYPFLLNYFARMSPGNGLHCVAISSKGQRSIVSHIGETQKIEVCDNYSQFEARLRNFCHTEAPAQKIYLLRHRGENRNNTNHTTAIYVGKQSQELIIYFADSTGGAISPNSWTALILASLKKTQIEIGSGIPLKIYFYSGRSRQVDHTNCVVYALQDAVYMSRKGDELVDWIKIDGHSEQLEDNILAVPLLPLPLMKTMQSLTAINAYLEITGLHAIKMPSKRIVDGKTLEMAVSRNIFISTDEVGNRLRRNGKVSKTFLKYERNIIRNAMIENLAGS